MAREKIMSPRQKYAEKIGKTVFQRGTTAQYIAEISGINAATVRSWRIDPGKMPAYQYLRILDAYVALENYSQRFS